MQNWQRETYTLRHSRAEQSLPIRWMEAFLPGEGVGGAANHWNGNLWRWSEYDPTLRSRYESHYGRAAIPADMPIQDWGTTYGELEPYHDLFERLFGLCGRAGNIGGAIQAGGNPFEAPRRGEYPQKPLEITEAGILFKEATESLGYRPFPQPAANSSGLYQNPDGQRLGQCQYCGHCERFICEAHAKSTPATLLYPMLRTRPSFELRTRAQVLHLGYDRRAKRATGVHYLDLNSGEQYEQPADVVVTAAFTMTNTRLLLLGGIGEPYSPTTRRGVVGKNFCYQTTPASMSFSAAVGSIPSSPRVVLPWSSMSSTTTISITRPCRFWAERASMFCSATGVRFAPGAHRRGRPDGAALGKRRPQIGIRTPSPSGRKAAAIRIAKTSWIWTLITRTSTGSRCCA